MVAVGRLDPSTTGPTEQIAFSHDSKDLFVIDPMALSVEPLRDPAVAVAAEFFHQGLNPMDEPGVRFHLDRLIVIAALGDGHEGALGGEARDSGGVESVANGVVGGTAVGCGAGTCSKIHSETFSFAANASSPLG